MFKEIRQGLLKFFTKERVIVLIIFIVLMWGLFTYSSTKTSVRDLMTTGGSDYSSHTQPTIVPHESYQQHGASPDTEADYSTMDSHHETMDSHHPIMESLHQSNGYALQPVANPSELLPNDQNSQWSALNPNTMSQGNIMMPDLLQAGYHIGLDTIGQTLRNPNLQLRSDPVIAKADVGPWNLSTIEPDLGRVPLEIGQGPR